MDRLSEISIGQPIRTDVLVDPFFVQVEIIKKLCADIKNMINTFQETTDKIILSVIASETKQYELQADILIDEINAKIKRVRDSIKNLKSDEKIYKNVYNVLVLDFMTIVSSFQKIQIAYKDKTMAKHKRWFNITNPGASFEEED